MGKINLSDIQPGMKLAADVKDRAGRLLLGAGSEITEKHLKVFKIWGVTEADIEGVEKEEIVAQATAQLDPVLLAEAEQKAKQLFRHTDQTHPFIEELFRLTTLRTVRLHTEGEEYGD